MWCQEKAAVAKKAVKQVEKTAAKDEKETVGAAKEKAAKIISAAKDRVKKEFEHIKEMEKQNEIKAEVRAACVPLCLCSA